MEGLVTVREGQPLANSRDIAAKFGKQHKHVLRDIDHIIRRADALSDAGHGPKLGHVIFQGVSQPHPTIEGRTDRSFDMNRDGFTLLAMGFTGDAALKWKLRYIEAFNAMEEEIRRPFETTLPDLLDPTILRQLLLTQVEANIALRAELDGQKPIANVIAFPTQRRLTAAELVLGQIRRHQPVSRSALTKRLSGRLCASEIEGAVGELAMNGRISVRHDRQTNGRPSAWYSARH